MSAESHPENDKPATGTASPEQPAAPQTTSAAASSAAAAKDQDGAQAYVDPTIAAEAKIAGLEADIADKHDRYVRVVAEMDNLRKRTEREKADTAKYAITSFARDMVAIADNLRRALAAASSSASAEDQSGPLKGLLEGVALTDQELQKALEKHGITPIPSDGQIFDPHKHQAMMERDDPSVPSGTILQVFQDGYQIGDRVLRPAMVVVAKGGARPAKTSEPSANLDEAAPPQAADDQRRAADGATETSGPSSTNGGQAGETSGPA